MIDTIEVTVNNKKYHYSRGITLGEICAEFQPDFKYPILMARVNNSLKELNYSLTKDCTIEFMDLTSHEGNRVHINGLKIILLYAVRRLFGKKANVKVQHSIDKGLYFSTDFKLTEEKIELIKDEMKNIVNSDLPIARLTIDRLEAIKYFRENGDDAKAEVMRYSTDTYINLYRLGNIYNYFYYFMPTTTSLIKAFDLNIIDDHGLIVRFPTVYITDRIKKYKHHPHLFEVFNEYKDWAKIMGVETSSDLNRIVSTGKINDLIKIDETLQSGRLLKVAKDIKEKRPKVKIVLIAGPSSSGKTTTSKKLCMYLKSFGLHPKTIGMDDYFVERKDNPKDEKGNYDYECLEAIDLKLFDKKMSELLSGKKVLLPTYDFVMGEKEFHTEMQLEENDILIIEGIHALDDKILTSIDRSKKYKIYISPLTEINLDNHSRVPTTDNRLLRRIVRDNRTRGHSVEATLEGWPKVREGEEKYIFPFQDDADATVSSAAIYELGVLKTYAEPLLYSVDSDSPYYEEAKKLLNFLKLFLPIPSDAIPEEAVIREFIGGSYFDVD